MKAPVTKTIWLSLLALVLTLTQVVAAQGLASQFGGKAGGKLRKNSHQQTRPVVGKTESKPETKLDKKVQGETVKAPEPAKQARLMDLFTPEEHQLARFSFGNPVAHLLVFREVHRRFPLSEKQRTAIIALLKEETPRLRALREQRGKQERALEEAIYGDTFDQHAIDQLVNESAAIQKEFMTRQAQLEAGLINILAAENRLQARLFLTLYEQVLGPQRNNQVPIAMLINRQYNGQWRILADLFGEDMDLMMPSFGSPLTILLVLRQLDLTPEQRAEFKALALEVRNEVRAEFEQRAKVQRELQTREQPARDAQERGNLLAERLENRLKMIEENAGRQARMMKRQTHIETRFRQILTPKQWENYTALIRAMLTGNLARPALPAANAPLLKNRQLRPMLKNPA
jgi:Spy/CpxP family protein refolding chaperone